MADPLVATRFGHVSENAQYCNSNGKTWLLSSFLGTVKCRSSRASPDNRNQGRRLGFTMGREGGGGVTAPQA